jgi:maleate isomerase
MPKTEGTIKIQPHKGWRAEVGMIGPHAWMFREYELVAPEGIRFSNAVLGVEEATPESEMKMVDSLELEAKKLNTGRKCDLICLGCTGASFVGGPGWDKKLIERIEKASGSPATTTSTCILELFKDLGIKKISLVGPYADALFKTEIEFLKGNGIETLYWKGLGLLSNSEFWDYSNDQSICYRLIKEGAKVTPEADCVFITCMVSHIAGIVDILEEEIDKPVISSLSATLYGILKKLEIPDPVYHYGRTLRMGRLPHQIKKEIV